ncbi:E3 ubiquitin-protein ligase RAD18, partial [Aplochiton taeniatus]
MALMHETDLPSNLACLKNIDTLLRCPICFEFINTAMMTKCSHNYCSLCIRKFLSYKLLCPVCNSPTTGLDLRNNRVLDDLVTSFQTARKQLSKATFDSPPISPTPGPVCNAPKQWGPKKDGSILSHFFQKGLTTPSHSTGTPDSQRGKPARPTVGPSRRKARQSQSVIVIDCSPPSSPESAPLLKVKEEPVEEEPVEEELPAQGLVSVKQENLDLSAADPLPTKVISPSTSSQDLKPVSKVECPVCSVAISEQFINKHLDTCLTRGEKKESLRSSPTGQRRPMGKLVYSLLTMQELKKRLKECHLSLQGTREQLIRRHQEFVQSYNAECDSLSPRSAEDIAKEVEANEKTRNQLNGKSKCEMVFTKKHSLEEIDKLHSSYRKQHSSEFSRLVAQVRGRLETSRQIPIKQERYDVGVETMGAHCTDNAADPKDSTDSLPGVLMTPESAA